MNGQLVYVLVAGFIVILNTLALFWLKDVKADVRELRQNYFNALQEVGNLKAEIASLKGIIDGLREELRTAKLN